MGETVERKFGDIELKLLKAKILNDVANILEQVSNKGENFLYPAIPAIDDVDRTSEILPMINPLIKGEFMGHMYEICTNGVHPTAYVSCECLATYNKKEDYDDLPVHGGCTFVGPKESGDGLWVGWDYGHFGDYMGPLGAIKNSFIDFGFAHHGGKKWTVAEVMQDVIKAILNIEESK